jgi:hypothetical protein
VVLGNLSPGGWATQPPMPLSLHDHPSRRHNGLRDLMRAISSISISSLVESIVWPDKQLYCRSDPRSESCWRIVQVLLLLWYYYMPPTVVVKLGPATQ